MPSVVRKEVIFRFGRNISPRNFLLLWQINYIEFEGNISPETFTLIALYMPKDMYMPLLFYMNIWYEFKLSSLDLFIDEYDFRCISKITCRYIPYSVLNLIYQHKYECYKCQKIQTNR